MKKREYIKSGFYSLMVLVLLFLTQCKPEEFTERTNYQLLIGEYLQEHPDQFSTFYEVLEKSGTLSFLRAYGAYTVFAPTNDAFEAYFQLKNKSGVDDFTKEELKDLVRYHTIADTIATTMFIDGKLQSPTMYGQYLTSRVNFEDGNAVYKMNKYAELDIKDLRLLNGVFHSVKSVMDPITKTIAEQIEENSDYSIFSEALKATGFYDTLNIRVEKGDPDPRWFTTIVIPNSAYEKDSIYSFNDLKAKYSDTGNPMDPLDSLNLYVAYHCIDNRLNYVADLQSSASHVTMAPLEVITIRTVGTSVRINEDYFDGEWETGYEIDRVNSDNTANNGVFHVMFSDFDIKVRLPFPIYWEPTDQLEIRKMPGVYGKIGSIIPFEIGQFEDISWEGGTPNDFRYICEQGSPNSIYPFVLHDYFAIYFRPTIVRWVEFKTPIIVKGKYKIWICTRNVYFPPTDRRKPIFFVYFDDEPLPVIIDNNITLNEGTSEEEYALQGLKWYLFWPDLDSTAYRYIDGSGVRRFVSQLAGTIDVTTTGRHNLKFVAISGGSGGQLWLDQVHFIPVKEEDPNYGQIWPRSNIVDNTPVYKEGLPPWIEPTPTE